MGYISTYYLETDKPIDNLQEILKEKTNETEWFFDKNHGNLTSKWYECLDDMCRISTKYPDILFTLYVDGEDVDDIWIGYFRNGKSYTASAQIVYPQFDETKLK